MADLGLKTFNKLYPMMIRKYQDLIVDQNATEKDKINQIIQKLNALGKLSNDVVRDWNTVYQWAMNDGLATDVNNKIEAMNANGELNTLLHNIFVSLTGDMSTLLTTVKDTTVNAINEVDGLAKQLQTNQGDLTQLQTTDKDSLVHAINDNVVQLAQIATIAKSNGVDDNANFVSWIATSNKIYIPPNVTLKLGYTAAASVITINKPIKIYGGGTIDFIGDFSKNSLFVVSSSNVRFRDINFTNNTGTIPAFAKGFISTLDTANTQFVSVRNCPTTNGGFSLNRTSNSKVKGCSLTNGNIMGYGGTGNSIEWNNIQVRTVTTNTGDIGINFFAYAGDAVKDWYVGHNTITNVGFMGICPQVQGGTISNCLIEANTIKLIANAGTTSREGISLAGVSKITVRNNDIFAPNTTGDYYAIECVNTDHCLIEGNRIEGTASGIIVNGTGSGLSYNNVVRENYIHNFTSIGIQVYRYTTGNRIHNNILKTNAITSSTATYGINLNGDAMNQFAFNQCMFNDIEIDGSSLGSVINIYGIYGYGFRTKIKDNVINIKGPNNAYGIRQYVGDSFGAIGLGKNNDISGNEIIMSLTTISSNTYGLLITHTTANDNMDGMIIEKNRISVLTPSGTTKWVASTAYTLNANVVPINVNGYYYTCTTAGTSGATEPTWPTTLNGTVTDGTAVWTCHGNQQISYTSSKLGTGIVANNFNVA